MGSYTIGYFGDGKTDTCCKYDLITALFKFLDAKDAKSVVSKGEQ